MKAAWDVHRLERIIGPLREGDVVFYGNFTKTSRSLKETLYLLLIANGFPTDDISVDKIYNGYIRVDKHGTVVYNDMENSGIFRRFLRRHGIVGTEKDWYKKIDHFEYKCAMRMTRGVLETLNGNLKSFNLYYEENILRDLDGREITEFLRTGDYSPSGTIYVSSNHDPMLLGAWRS